TVSSCQFDMEFDPKVISPKQLAAEVTGTMGRDMAVVSNAPAPGLLKVVVYGPVPVQGDGVYVNLKFTVIGSSGASTPVKLTNVRINNAERSATTASGRVTIR